VLGSEDRHREYKESRVHEEQFEAGEKFHFVGTNARRRSQWKGPLIAYEW